MVNITANVTQPGSTAYTLIHSNRGHSVDRATLEAAYFPTAVPSCQRNCNLDSVTYCIGRDAAGEGRGCSRCQACCCSLGASWQERSTGLAGYGRAWPRGLTPGLVSWAALEGDLGGPGMPEPCEACQLSACTV